MTVIINSSRSEKQRRHETRAENSDHLGITSNIYPLNAGDALTLVSICEITSDYEQVVRSERQLYLIRKSASRVLLGGPFSSQSACRLCWLRGGLIQPTLVQLFDKGIRLAIKPGVKLWVAVTMEGQS